MFGGGMGVGGKVQVVIRWEIGWGSINFKKYATSYHRKSHLIILFLVRCTSGERDVREDGGGGHVVSDRLSVELISWNGQEAWLP